MSSAPKIRVMNLIYNLDVGGAEKFLLALIPRMQNDNFEISVCTLRAGGVLEPDFKARGIGLFSLGWRKIYFPFYVFRLAWLLRRMKIDILHTHLYKSEVTGTLAGILARTPVILTTKHNQGSWMKRSEILVERFLARFQKLQICVSESVRTAAVKRGLSQIKTVVVYPSTLVPEKQNYDAVEIKKEYGIPVSAKVIGTLGRLHPVKGHKYLLQAFAKVQSRIPDSFLIIAGDGELRTDLLESARSLNISPKVRIIPHVQNVSRILSIFDIFVLSSLSEGFAVSILEAMANRKAVVASSVGGVPEVVLDQKTGLLVSPGSSEAISGAVLRLLENDDLRRKLGESGYEFATGNFTLDKTALALQKIFEGLRQN